MMVLGYRKCGGYGTDRRHVRTSVDLTLRKLALSAMLGRMRSASPMGSSSITTCTERCIPTIPMDEAIYMRIVLRVDLSEREDAWRTCCEYRCDANAAAG